ncbi:MAG: 50S ribosomal protein L24 [Peptoniphilaceae bacterium]|jgi:large subunit ribosomal protein L24|nr:50S ribosomal protein L24 [Bacillota bacterium]
MRYKVNDQVIVTTGKYKGKVGKVLKVDRHNDRVIVEGVNVQTRHKKPRGPQNPGGIVKSEGAIHASNVMLYDAKNQKPSKVGIKTTDGGKRVRFLKSSGQQIDK